MTDWLELGKWEEGTRSICNPLKSVRSLKTPSLRVSVAYSQTEIDELISCPKNLSDPPRRDMRLVGADWRNDMKLVSDGRPGEFAAFFRRSEDFPENFSIGLTYDLKDGNGEITLLRCNGQHGVFNGTFDPQHPHWHYHIHRASEEALMAGSRPEKYATVTTAYA